MQKTGTDGSSRQVVSRWRPLLAPKSVHEQNKLWLCLVEMERESAVAPGSRVGVEGYFVSVDSKGKRKVQSFRGLTSWEVSLWEICFELF